MLFARSGIVGDASPACLRSLATRSESSTLRHEDGLIVTMVKGPLPNGMTAKEWVTNANAAALAGIAKATQPVIYNTLTGIGDGAFVTGTGADPTKAFTSASLTFYVRDTFVTLLLSFTPATSEPVPSVTALARLVAPLVPH